jgi:hypothetical protein
MPRTIVQLMYVFVCSWPTAAVLKAIPHFPDEANRMPACFLAAGFAAAAAGGGASRTWKAFEKPPSKLSWGTM